MIGMFIVRLIVFVPRLKNEEYLKDEEERKRKQKEEEKKRIKEKEEEEKEEEKKEEEEKEEEKKEEEKKEERRKENEEEKRRRQEQERRNKEIAEKAREERLKREEEEEKIRKKELEIFLKIFHIRRIICCSIMFIFTIFLFFYNIVFCSLYNNTQIIWFYSGIWCLLFEWIILSPLYILLISYVEKKGRIKKKSSYLMKQLFFF